MNQPNSLDRRSNTRSWTLAAASGATLLALLALPNTAAAAPRPYAATSWLAQDSEKDRKAEFDRQYEAAKSDVAKLWDLYDWCEAYGMERYQKRVLNAVLKLDENDRRANEILGHEFYEGKWWSDLKKLEKYRLEKEKAEAEAKGWVVYNGRYVDPKDIPFLERGLVKNEDGEWIDKEEQEKLAAGWVRQDLEWISPEEKENVEKGLWKCGTTWLKLEEANRYHSELGREWRIPYGDIVIRTTLPRETADEIAKDLNRALVDVERFFGRSVYGVHVLILNSLDQFNGMAAGGSGGAGISGGPGADNLGWSSVRGAYFADGLYDSRARRFDGLGVALWDLKDPNGARFGRHFARFALGISAAEAIDSSPKARKSMETSGISQVTFNAFYSEKFLPPVLRYGFASYCDRYFRDATAPPGSDTQWARKWSVQNLTQLGGLDPLARVLPFQFDNSSEQAVAGTTKLLNQAGLVVSFILDAKCEPVVAAHNAFKVAITSGDRKIIEKASAELLDAVLKNEAAYRRWAES